jgi:hypothetical protein
MKKTEQLDSETAKVTEAQIAKGYVAAVWALLLEDGDPPLKLPRLMIYARAQEIQASLRAYHFTVAFSFL